MFPLSPVVEVKCLLITIHTSSGYFNFGIKLLEVPFPFSTQCIGSCIHQELMDEGFPTEYSLNSDIGLNFSSQVSSAFLPCETYNNPSAFPGDILGEKPDKSGYYF